MLCTEQSPPARRLAVPWWGSVRPPIAHAWPNPTIMHTLHVDVTKGVSLTDQSFGIKQIAANVDGGQS